MIYICVVEYSICNCGALKWFDFNAFTKWDAPPKYPKVRYNCYQ